MINSKQKKYIFIKTSISIGAWLIALIGSAYSDNYDMLKYILPALMMCTLGDIFLALSDEIHIKLLEPYFTLGVASFGIAHVIFGIYFLSLCDFNISFSIILSPITALLLWYLKHAGILKCGKYSTSIMLYALLVGAFLGLGINLVISAKATAEHMALCIASILFWCSDLSLSFRYFTGKRTPALAVFILASYFTAIYTIAFTAF